MINTCMVELDEPLKTLDAEVEYLTKALQQADFACRVFKSQDRVFVDIHDCTHPDASLTEALNSQGVSCIVYDWDNKDNLD